MSTQAHPDYAAAPTPEEWKLRLYVTDWTPRCVAAYRNLMKICQEHVGDKCNIEVVDLLEQPEAARRDQIVAVPTLVKVSPRPSRVLVGDFTKLERVLKGLDIDPAGPPREGTTMISWQPGNAASGPAPLFLETAGAALEATRVGTGPEKEGGTMQSGGMDGR